MGPVILDACEKTSAAVDLAASFKRVSKPKPSTPVQLASRHVSNTEVLQTIWWLKHIVFKPEISVLEFLEGSLEQGGLIPPVRPGPARWGDERDDGIPRLIVQGTGFD
jgi:hypothetical protein